jgi:hypothetical protein
MESIGLDQIPTHFGHAFGTNRGPFAGSPLQKIPSAGFVQGKYFAALGFGQQQASLHKIHVSACRCGKGFYKFMNILRVGGNFWRHFNRRFSNT